MHDSMKKIEKQSCTTNALCIFIKFISRAIIDDFQRHIDDFHNAVVIAVAGIAPICPFDLVSAIHRSDRRVIDWPMRF